MATVRYSLSLDAVKDAKIAAWIDAQPNASKAVREILRAYLEEQPSTADLNARLVQMQSRLDRLLNLLRSRPVSILAESEEGDEPTKARQGLDAMKRRFGE